MIARSSDPLAARSEPASFSRPLVVDGVPDDGLDLTIEAEPCECEAVANQVRLPSIGALSASFHIARRPGGRLQVDGDVRAKITQMCVVSLQPFEREIEQPIEIAFAPPKFVPADRNGRAVQGGASRRRRVELPETQPAPAAEEEDDPPDPIVAGRIDLGVVAVEFLTLGLDFYPKKPGVQFTETVVGETDAPEPSAFAALERLKDRS